MNQQIMEVSTLIDVIRMDLSVSYETIDNGRGVQNVKTTLGLQIKVLYQFKVESFSHKSNIYQK